MVSRSGVSGILQRISMPIVNPRSIDDIPIGSKRVETTIPNVEAKIHHEYFRIFSGIESKNVSMHMYPNISRTTL